MSEAFQYMNNGVAIVVLVACGFFAWRLALLLVDGIKHSFSQVIIPLKDAGINHLQSMSQSFKSLEETNRSVCETLGTVKEDVSEIKARVHSCVKS